MLRNALPLGLRFQRPPTRLLQPHRRLFKSFPPTSISLAPSEAPAPDPTQQPQPSPSPPPEGEGKGKGGGGPGGGPGPYDSAISSALSTIAGVTLLASTGIFYHQWYKWDVLRKMGRAFGEGYDPVLELATASDRDGAGKEMKAKVGKIRRDEQEFVGEIVNGLHSGQYYLLLGPKGAGKTTLVVQAMVDNGADGVALVEAHEDPEVFRLRFGKALDFEYSEDSFAGLFQRRDPREAGPLLDIERALNKLEKVAIKYRRERGRPLVLVINNIHFIKPDDAGHSLLHMLQQRAESWSQAGILTTIFSSDDFLPYTHLKKNASRMQVVTVSDLSPAETHAMLARSRSSHFPSAAPLDANVSMAVWDLIGGRLSVLSKLARTPDMLQAAQKMVQEEKNWMLGRLGLIPDLDDDVMDEQKVSSCSFLLFQEFARLAEEDEAANQEALTAEATRLNLLPPIAADDEDLDVYDLPNLRDHHDVKVDYRQAREIMTRPDYLSDLDHHNILNISWDHMVRPDSRLMLSVFREVCAEPDFQDKLTNVRDRVDEIESLHRTAELTVKPAPADLGGFLRLRVGALLREAEAEGEGKDEGEGRLV